MAGPISALREPSPLRQYILRYTVGNPTSLRNVAFYWLTSEYMQLASGFISKQYTRRGNSNTLWGNFYLRIIESKIQVSAG